MLPIIGWSIQNCTHDMPWSQKKKSLSAGNLPFVKINQFQNMLNLALFLRRNWIWRRLLSAGLSTNVSPFLINYYWSRRLQTFGSVVINQKNAFQLHNNRAHLDDIRHHLSFLVAFEAIIVLQVLLSGSCYIWNNSLLLLRSVLYIIDTNALLVSVPSSGATLIDEPRVLNGSFRKLILTYGPSGRLNTSPVT